MIVLHQRSIRWRNLVPPAFVVMLLASAAIAHRSMQEALMLPGVYLLINLIVSAIVARKRGVRFVFVLPAIFVVMHLCWGSGFLWCALRNGLRDVNVELNQKG